MRAMIAAVIAIAAALPGAAQTDAQANIGGCIQDADVILRIEACTRVIKAGDLAGPDLAWAFNNRGLAYQQLKRPERALGDYNTALLLDPNYAVGYNNRGNVLAAMNDLQGALSDHTRAIELDPTYADAYYNRGADFEELGDVEAALRDYDRALEADPNFTLARISRVAVHCALGNIEAAVEDQVQLIELEHFTAEQVQEYLRDRGFYQGAIDGIFGRGSRGALRSWVEAGCP